MSMMLAIAVALAALLSGILIGMQGFGSSLKKPVETSTTTISSWSTSILNSESLKPSPFGSCNGRALLMTELPPSYITRDPNFIRSVGRGERTATNIE